jgi:hypothetical protein
LTALAATAIALLALPGHAGLGDLDMRFGSNGQLEIADPYRATVLVQPDGKVMAVGNLVTDRGADLRYLVLARWLADGRPDRSYGQGGRIVVPAPAWNDAVVGAAVLQPDGKVVLAGAGGVGTVATGKQWVRYLARVDANGNLDPSFGTAGLVDGGTAGPGFDGFGVGYSALRVLPNGDLIALIDAQGARFIDRFSPDGRLVASTEVGTGPVIDFAADSDTTVIVLSRQRQGADLWRLLPNGQVDRQFGKQGYVEVLEFFAGALAADRSGRIVLCDGQGLQAFDLRGRVDQSFGPLGNGSVTFNDLPTPSVGGCLAISMRPGRLNDFGAITVVGVGVGYDSKPVVARLDGQGRIDRAIGAGTGWQVLRERRATGTDRTMRALLDRGAENPLVVWGVTDASGGSRQRVQALDLGLTSRRGAAGVAELGRPYRETTASEVLTIVRSGPLAGSARVRFELLAGTAGRDDVELRSGELLWADGDGTAREIAFAITNDDLLEGEETFRLRLFDPTGIDVGQEFTTFTIADDDVLRALRFEQRSITWIIGPNIPTSEWPVWKLRLDDPVPGPVTVYYQLDNGWDACCIGQVQWAGGEQGARSIAPFPGRFFGDSYQVSLLDVSYDFLAQAAGVSVVVETTPVVPPSPPPTGGSPFNPTPNPSGGDTGGGGAFDLAAAAAWLALLLVVRRPGRRHALR